MVCNCSSPPPCGRGAISYFHRPFAAVFRLLPVLALTCATTLSATIVKPTDFNRLVDQAELIFAGEVVGVRSDWAPGEGRPVIITKVTFQVDEIYKGKAALPMELEFLGGTVGTTRLEVEGVPIFQVGERAVLFVEKNGTSFCPLVGIYHGKLDLKRHPEKGGDCLWRHDGKPLTDTAEIGREKPSKTKANNAPEVAKGPLTLPELKQQISARLAKSGGR